MSYKAIINQSIWYGLACLIIARPYLLLAESTATVYDKDNQVKEYLRERPGYIDQDKTIEIFNKDWTRKGYIKKEGDRYTIYDKNWERQGYINLKTAVETSMLMIWLRIHEKLAHQFELLRSSKNDSI